MSGDVQPRKRKDKKKKKDDLGTEEPRGTAAALGEGDVFMHSYQDHGTGGHWCAKIIFFSLLAVLVTLIGLIILENRGLTELEANSVESRYSGVLEGWIEDAVDDHHDEHTLELKHHDDDEDHPDDQLYENESEESLEEEIDHNENDESNEDEGESNEIEDHSQNEDDDDGDEEDELENDDGDEEDELENDDGVEEDELENDEDGVDDDDEDEIQNYDDEERETHNNDDEGQNEDGDDEDDEKYDEEIEEKFKNEDDEEETYQHYIYEDISESNKNDDEDDEEQTHDFSKEITSHFKYHESYEDNDDESKENKYDDDIESNEHNTEDDASEEDKQGDDDDEDDEQAIEKIEREISDGDVSEEIADNHASKEQKDASKESVKEELSKVDAEPPIEKISRPQAGKPFVEIEEETPLKPVDTLAEEEAYERQQEELRRQEEEAPHSLWLKLCVGGALLAATSALVRRATRPDAPEAEEPVMEETPSLSDRRMTIIDEPIRVTQTTLSRAPRQVVDEEVFKRPAPVIQSAPTAKPKIEEEIAKEVVAKVLELPKSDAKKEEDKELYSEEEKEEEEDEDEDVEEDNQLPETETSKKEAEESEPEADPEEVSDVEIIYDETVEEEEIPDEEIEEEEISDVDDTELLSRLEAKYGRLPEPERPGQYKGGGNSLEAEWPGEPSDPYWRSQLDTAEEEFRQGRWTEAGTRAGGGGLAGCGRARWLRASALHAAADHAHDDRLLAAAVAAYLHLLRMHDKLSDRQLRRVASRALDRIHFTGAYMRAEPVYRLLIRRFPDDVDYRNNLTISFLMANRADLADEVLRETLRLWPNDRVALAHHGFVLKTHHIKLEEAVEALRKALDGDAGRANEPRFYYHLGDALLLLGRLDEAHEVHRRGANLGHFLSASQRSLYNVPRLRARPWWRVEDTPYVELARALEESWRDILREGEAAVALYEQEREGLKDRGEWSQLDIFVRGREVEGRCRRAPALCAALRGAPCRRGQVKFSLMAPGTHVRPHVGPTNCRLRMHLALSNTEGTYIRVDKETRQWQLGKTLMFDDSFEHEVWHNGTGPRLVLIVDVWHPDLTAAERRQLPAI